MIVGKVAGQHGVKGWLKVLSFTRPLEQILEYDRWMLAEHEASTDWQAVTVTEANQHSKKLLAKLAGIDDRDAAATLVGKWIAIAPTQLAALPHGEYYWNDLIGLSVINQDGVKLGVVERLIETGANDVLVVNSGSGDDAVERLLPWVAHVIVAVEVENECIRVEWDVND